MNLHHVKAFLIQMKCFFPHQWKTFYRQQKLFVLSSKKLFRQQITFFPFFSFFGEDYFKAFFLARMNLHHGQAFLIQMKSFFPHQWKAFYRQQKNFLFCHQRTFFVSIFFFGKLPFVLSLQNCFVSEKYFLLFKKTYYMPGKNFLFWPVYIIIDCY